MYPGDRVVQLNLQTLGVQFNRLLRHPGTTMGPPHGGDGGGGERKILIIKENIYCDWSSGQSL